MDAIVRGAAMGSVAQMLLASNFDTGALRPYEEADGKSYKALMVSGKREVVEINAQASLRYEEWVTLDTVVQQTVAQRAKVASDMLARGLKFSIPNGMASSILISQKMSELGPASIGMTGLEQGNDETPQFDSDSLPLPISHKGININLRTLATSRNGGQPLDVTDAILAGRAVGETIERLTVGTSTAYTFAGLPVYGLTNHPNRITAEIADWNTAEGSVVLANVLAMIASLQAQRKYGPYVLYVSNDFDLNLNRDYSSTYPSGTTIRQRLLSINGLQGIVPSDFMPTSEVSLIDANVDSVRIVDALAPQTLQWEEKGGLLVCLKAMAIQVPHIRLDFSGRVGVLHGTIPVSS